MRFRSRLRKTFRAEAHPAELRGYLPQAVRAEDGFLYHMQAMHLVN